MIFDQSLQAYLHEVDDVLVAWEEKPSGNFEMEAQLLAANYHKNLYRILAFILPHLQEFYGYSQMKKLLKNWVNPSSSQKDKSLLSAIKTFDDIHIFSFDYQGRHLRVWSNFAIDG